MKPKLVGITIVVGTAMCLSTAIAQLVTGTPQDNKLVPRSNTFYVNVPPDTTPPDNVNNNKTESLGVAISSSGNVIIGWEDDGDGLTDWEAVWTMYNPLGQPITPDTVVTSIDPAYAGQTITTRFLSYFRKDGSAISGRTGWGPKIKANLFGTGVGMGSSTWDLGKEVVEFAPWTDANEDDYPAVQLLTDDGRPIGIVAGVSSEYAQGAGAIRIGDWDYLSNGNIVIVGESRQEDELVSKYGGAAKGRHIIFRIVDPAGNVVKAETLVSDTPTPGEMWHGVGVTKNGFGVRWSAGGRATVRLFDNTGNPITPNIDLGTLTGKEIAAGGGRGDSAGFHGNGDNLYVAICSGRDEQQVLHVWVTVLKADGTLVYSKSVSDDYVLTSVGGTDAAIDAKGRVFAVWDARIENDWVDSLVMGRVLDETGKPIGGTFYISESEYETSFAYFKSEQPRVAARGDQFAVVWESNNCPDYSGAPVVAARLFGVLYEPGTIEAEGLTRIVPDTVIDSPQYDALGNWEPYASVLGNSVFLIECNTFATNTADKQQFVVQLQPVDGSKPAKLTYAFYTDAGVPYGDEFNLSRQNGNPGRVAGDKRPGAVNFMTGAEVSPHGYPDLFNSDGRWGLFTSLLDNSSARYGCVQTFKLDLETLTPTPLSKVQDSANGRVTSGVLIGDQVTRFGGDLVCLDNGNFVSVVEDRSRLRREDGNCGVATIFAPDGTVVKETFKVADGDIWSNACAYRGGFAVRMNGIIYFYDNDGNLKGQIDQAVSGRSFDRGRGDGTRIQGHINSPYVFLTGTTGGKLVSLAAFDSRDLSFVAVQDVSEAGFPGTADRVNLAVDALNRVIVAWASTPEGYEAYQVAARVMALNENTKTITPLTHSFFAFINTAKTGGIRSYQMSPAITTKQIMIAAKGEINMQNKPELGIDSPKEVNFYTVFTHPAPAEDPTPGVGGPAPTLSVTLTGTTVTVSWAPAATGWVLQATDSLSNPNWTNVGTANPTVITVGPGAKFYRLQRQ